MFYVKIIWLKGVVMQENIIKPHLVKPVLEKIVYEKLQLPHQNEVINIKPQDEIEIRKISEEVVRVTLTRSLQISPANLMKTSVTMSIDIPIDSIEFSKLSDPKDYIKNSQPVRILVAYVSNVLTNLTINTILGPIVTPPNIQE